MGLNSAFKELNTLLIIIINAFFQFPLPLIVSYKCVCMEYWRIFCDKEKKPLMQHSLNLKYKTKNFSSADLRLN
jgi:hypothetical protein